MRVAALYIYPVKSLRPVEVSAAEVDALGFCGDRRFLVVDHEGKFLTQRTLPRMALIDALLEAESLVLRSEGHGETRVARLPQPGASLMSVRVWKSEGLQVEDCGEEPALWLEDILEVRCRLVRIGGAYTRPVKPQKAMLGDQVSFADAYPFLAISKASLDDLNSRLMKDGQGAVPMNRFRPNIVLEGLEAFEEDRIGRLRIGPCVMRAGGPCARCVMTTTDAMTGVRSVEPLRTLATYRRDPAEPSQVNFGQNLVHETKSGWIRVGDPVEVIA